MQELNLLDVAELNCGENIFRFPPGFIHSVKNIDWQNCSKSNSHYPLKKPQKPKTKQPKPKKTPKKHPQKKTPKKPNFMKEKMSPPECLCLHISPLHGLCQVTL